MPDEGAVLVPVLVPIDATQRADLERSVAAFGFASFVNALTPVTLAALRAETRTCRAGSVFSEWTSDGKERPEGTASSYCASANSLGPLVLGVLTGAPLLNRLRDYFGGEYELTEAISCITFYDAYGHLGAHLDRPAEDCAVTIIVYLEATSPDPAAPDTGLVLNVYGEEATLLDTPRLRIPTRAGTIVLGRGSRIWHERPRLKEGESVVAITGCYRQLP